MGKNIQQIKGSHIAREWKWKLPSSLVGYMNLSDCKFFYRVQTVARTKTTRTHTHDTQITENQTINKLQP